MITQARLKELLEYNPVSGLFTWKVDRRKVKPGDVAGKTTGTYVQIKIDYILYYAHRLAFLYMEGKFPADEVDHKNGNRIDNSWTNLRHCNRQQNLRNRHSSREYGNKSGFKNVSLEGNKYIVEFCINGKTERFGSYYDLELANNKATEIRKLIHGEFAKD